MSPIAHNRVADGQPEAAAELEVTRSDEELLIHIERQPYQQVRIRKVIVTELRTIAIEVRREQLHIETTDIDGCADPAPTGEQAPLELVLHEEEIVIQRSVVPRERIRIGLDVIHEPVAVREGLRHERVAVYQPQPPHRQ